MPDGRFLSKSIAYSAQIGSVSLEADYLFMRMIPHLDSAGRMAGAPASVKALVCPLRPELTAERVAGLLKELHDAGLIVWYESGGQHCTSFPGFAAHQRGARLDREGPSRLPGPPRRPSTKLRRTPENSGERRVSEVKRSEVKTSKESAGAVAPRDSKGERPRPDWLLPISVVWERHKGAGTFQWGKAGKHLKPLHEAGHNSDRIAGNLDRYIPAAGKFVSLPRFAETFADYDAVKLTGPPIVDGWLSSEVDRLTRPAGLVA